MNGAELIVDNLEQDGADAEVGGVSVEVYGMGIVEVKIFDNGTNGGF